MLINKINDVNFQKNYFSSSSKNLKQETKCKNFLISNYQNKFSLKNDNAIKIKENALIGIVIALMTLGGFKVCTNLNNITKEMPAKILQNKVKYTNSLKNTTLWKI